MVFRKIPDLNRFTRMHLFIGQIVRKVPPLFLLILLLSCREDYRELKGDPSQWSGKRITRFKELGKTGFMVSPVGFGCASSFNVEVALKAIELGINYFDVAPDYAGGTREEELGIAVERSGKRKEIFIATKLCGLWRHQGITDSTDVLMGYVEDSLKRLRTDYIDVLMIHSIDDIRKFRGEQVQKAFEILKREKKIRFIGASGHSKNSLKIIEELVEEGELDVILIALNIKPWRFVKNLIEKAKAKGIGVVGMKLLKTAYRFPLKGFFYEGVSYPQLALRWADKIDGLSTVLMSTRTLEQVDEFVSAVGE